MNIKEAARRIQAGLPLPDLTLIDRDALQAVRDLQFRHRHAQMDPARATVAYERTLQAIFEYPRDI